MRKKASVTLTIADRQYLTALIAAGTAPARKLSHARWSLRLLAENLVDLDLVDDLYYQAVPASRAG